MKNEWIFTCLWNHSDVFLLPFPIIVDAMQSYFSIFSTHNIRARAISQNHPLLLLLQPMRNVVFWSEISYNAYKTKSGGLQKQSEKGHKMSNAAKTKFKTSYKKQAISECKIKTNKKKTYQNLSVSANYVEFKMDIELSKFAKFYFSFNSS